MPLHLAPIEMNHFRAYTLIRCYSDKSTLIASNALLHRLTNQQLPLVIHVYIIHIYIYMEDSS